MDTRLPKPNTDMRNRSSKALVRSILQGELTTTQVQALCPDCTPPGVTRLLRAVQDTWGQWSPASRPVIWAQTWILIGGVLAAQPDTVAVAWSVKYAAHPRPEGHELAGWPDVPELYRVLMAPRLVQFGTRNPMSDLASAAVRQGLRDLPSHAVVRDTLRAELVDQIEQGPAGLWWANVAEAWAENDSEAWRIALTTSHIVARSTEDVARAAVMTAARAIWSLIVQEGGDVPDAARATITSRLGLTSEPPA